MTSEPGTIIRIWRKMRELSQADAAAYAHISTRHLSFIENGRTKPSVTTITAIAAALYMPEGDKNRLLLAAGYAPKQRARLMSDEEHERATAVFADELAGCGDRPAFAADECWGLIDCNDAFSALVAPLIVSGDLLPADQENFAHLVFHPAGLRRIIANWHNFSAFFMLMMRAESMDKPASHDFHELIARIHPWSEDQDGADILEPYTLSAIAFPVKLAAPGGAARQHFFTTMRFAAPSSSPVSATRIGKFLHAP